MSPHEPNNLRRRTNPSSQYRSTNPRHWRQCSHRTCFASSSSSSSSWSHENNTTMGLLHSEPQSTLYGLQKGRPMFGNAKGAGDQSGGRRIASRMMPEDNAYGLGTKTYTPYNPYITSFPLSLYDPNILQYHILHIRCKWAPSARKLSISARSSASCSKQAPTLHGSMHT